MSRHTCQALLALWLLAHPSSAMAAPARKTGPSASTRDAGALAARAQVALAREAHRMGQYERAIAAWKEAHALRPRPALLFNLAQSQRMAARWRDSRDTLARFLAQLETLPDDERVGLPSAAEIRARVAELDEKVNASSGTTTNQQAASEAGPAVRPEPSPVLFPLIADTNADAGAVPGSALAGLEPTIATEEKPFPWWTASLWSAAGVLATAAGASWLMTHQGWTEAVGIERPRAEVDRHIGLYDGRFLLSQVIGVAAAMTSVAATAATVAEQ